MRKLVDIVTVCIITILLLSINSIDNKANSNRPIQIHQETQTNAKNNVNTSKKPYYLMTSTGYYPGPECTHPFTDGFTAIGEVAGRGCIAIDDSSGPLRMEQEVYVEEYGYGKCNDRGSAIKGWRIDLCLTHWKRPKSGA